MQNVELYIFAGLDPYNIAITAINGNAIGFASANVMISTFPNFFIIHDEYGAPVLACIKPMDTQLTITTAAGTTISELAKLGVKGGVLMGGRPIHARP